MNTCGFSLMSGGAKDLVAGTDMFYPAVFGFWKKAEISTATILKKDKVLRFKIEEYIVRSKQMMSDIDARISSLLARSSLDHCVGNGSACHETTGRDFFVWRKYCCLCG